MRVIHRVGLTSASTAIALLLALPGTGFVAPVAGSDDHAGSRDTDPDNDPEKAVVVPYESRPAPTHRVSLRDDRVFFVKKLEKTDNGFVLHTLEDEVIEVEQTDVAEIVELNKE